MQIRAERYLDQCRDRKEFTQLVENLRQADFGAACKFYDRYVPELTNPEQAFLAANDRFFLMSEVLGRKNIKPSLRHPWMYERCREVEAKTDGYVDLWAREHGKSTIITCCGSLQEIIHDPEITIGIFSVVQDVAGRFVRQLMDEMEGNEWLKRICPDVFFDKPKIQSPLWSKIEGLIVKRQGRPKEPTVSGWGLIDGMPVGMHFKLRVYDDVINEKYQNADQCQKALERWELSDNLGSGEGRLWAIGTRYFLQDPYETMMERGVVVPRIYPATDNGRSDGKPVFWSKENWERKKKTQRATLAAQLLQNPLADGHAIFDPLTLRPYGLRPRTLRIYILGDYAGSKSKTSDKTAFAVIGIDAGGNKYLLDGFCHRMSLTEKWKCLSHLYTKWEDSPGVQGIEVGYERYGAISDIQYFEEMMKLPGAPRFPIKELGYVAELKDQSKKSRVARLEPDFAASKFYLASKVWRPNAAWWIVGKDGWEHPQTKKVYKPGQEMGGPMPDDAGGIQHVGPRICLWSVRPEDGRIQYRPIPMEDSQHLETQEDGTSRVVKKTTGSFNKFGVFIPGARMRHTSLDRQAIDAKEPYRIVTPIHRFDDDENAYDLTHVAIEQIKGFPKTNEKDLLDAISRIFDMNPVNAMIIDEELLRTPVYEY